MSDYISREALLRMVGHRPTTPTTDREDRLISAFISTIETFPAADVRPVVRGRWVEEAVYYADDGNPCSAFFCNQCSTPFVEKYNFCPNCGADMRGEQDV